LKHELVDVVVKHGTGLLRGVRAKHTWVGTVPLHETRCGALTGSNKLYPRPAPDATLRRRRTALVRRRKRSIASARDDVLEAGTIPER
jgi:hypothetical protein